MKPLLYLIFGLAATTLISCVPRTANNDPYATNQATANPYGVPQATPPAQEYAPYPTTPAQQYPQQSYPTAAPAPLPSTGGTSYTVQKGDTLWGLSRKYGTSVSAIQASNGLTSSNIIVGQTLTIPQ